MGRGDLAVSEMNFNAWWSYSTNKKKKKKTLHTGKYLGGLSYLLVNHTNNATGRKNTGIIIQIEQAPNSSALRTLTVIG